MSTHVLADEMGFTEGPVFLPDGRIAVTSINHGCVYVVAQDGGIDERLDTGGGPNGLAAGPDGALYVAQNGGIFGASGAATPGVQVIRDGRVSYLADGMGAPNDLVFGPDGRLWVTDTRGEIDFFNPDPAMCGRVWAVDIASGTSELVLDNGPIFINGLGFAPGGDLLVTSTSEAKMFRYSAGGDVVEVCGFDGGWPDGMAVDRDGNYWVALTAGDRLDHVTPTGDVLDRVDTGAGSLPTNVCLSPDEAHLYVTASHFGALLRITPAG